MIISLVVVEFASYLQRLVENEALTAAWTSRDPVLLRDQFDFGLSLELLTDHLDDGGLLLASQSKDDSREGWKVGSAKLRSGTDFRELLQEGSTLVVNGAAETVPLIGKLAIAASNVIAAPISVNAYVTTLRGAPRHSDTQEVLALQLTGRQRWTLDETTFDVGPRDLVYVPAGVPHQTEALSPPSFHLTFGVEYHTFDLLDSKRRPPPVGILGAADDCRRVFGSLAPQYVRHNRRILDAQHRLYTIHDLTDSKEWARRLMLFSHDATLALLDHRRQALGDPSSEANVDNLIDDSRLATALYIRSKLHAQGLMANDDAALRTILDEEEEED